MTELIESLIGENGLIFGFLLVGIIILVSSWLTKSLTQNKIPWVAIAIIISLLLAYFGGEKGIASFPIFTGLGLLGGSMLRDFSVVSTAMGADIHKIRAAGIAGVVALFMGVLIAFVLGGIIAFMFGYTDAKSITTIGAGACTYIVGPITGSALDASSDVIAISIATGVVKTIITTISTPFIAKSIGLNNPKSAIVFGGLIGTTSGVAAGLAATDPKLVPYGTLTATFFTGLGCLLCPSIFYFTIKILIS